MRHWFPILHRQEFRSSPLSTQRNAPQEKTGESLAGAQVLDCLDISMINRQVSQLHSTPGCPGRWPWSSRYPRGGCWHCWNTPPVDPPMKTAGNAALETMVENNTRRLRLFFFRPKPAHHPKLLKTSLKCWFGGFMVAQSLPLLLPDCLEHLWWM